MKIHKARAVWCITCTLSALLLASCSSSEANDTEPSRGVRRARAVLKPTSDNQVEGVVTFTEEEEGVQISADIRGLSPGKHGFHIHEFGVCEGDATSAGDHFNPAKSRHGSPDNKHRHAGDLGNLRADSQGNARYERLDRVVKLNGEDTIVGRAVIVHEKEDDFRTQPTGNAGKRLSCGVIEIVE